MTKTQAKIDTSAEAVENAILPMIGEVHTDPNRIGPMEEVLAPALREPAEKKSPAQWAYERVIMYIQKFEETLDNDHEVGLGFAGGDAGVIRIEGLGFFDPDIITYFGSNDAGAKTQLIQHVSQLNVMLTAFPKKVDQVEPQRIGFRLGRALERTEEKA